LDPCEGVVGDCVGVTGTRFNYDPCPFCYKDITSYGWWWRLPTSVSSGNDAGDDEGDRNEDDRCDTPLPDGSTVRENVAFVENIILNSPRDPEGMDVPYLVAGGYVFGSIIPGGPWDYKIQPGSTGDEMGNFNFGATGSLLLPADILARGGGVVQSIQHFIDPRHHPSGDGNPFGQLPNVGDVGNDTPIILEAAGKCR
jgi:hypothetical protein